MLSLFVVWTLLGGGSAFRFGDGQVLHAVNRKSFSELSAEPSAPSFSTASMPYLDWCAMFDLTCSISLMTTQMVVNASVFPAIDNSPFLSEKYPNPLNRTVQNVLGGLPDVVDIEYLHTLPVNDPRRYLLTTIQDPGPERRAELNENLQAIDSTRGKDGKKTSTYSVYQRLSRDTIDSNLRNTLKAAAAEETLRRKIPEFTEYGTSDWFVDFCAQELLQFVEKCFKKGKTGLLCKHPSLSFYFPYYLAGEAPLAQRYYTLSELCILTEAWQRIYATFRAVFEDRVYPAISESPIIAEKYPDPADRTPHKLLGGLANIVSIEYMQSLEPHDPRRLFLDTLKPPDARRRVQLEMNALLVDKAVLDRTEHKTGQFALRTHLLGVVKSGVEVTYLASLQSAKVLEMVRRYAKNNGVVGADLEGDAYRLRLMDMFSK